MSDSKKIKVINTSGKRKTAVARASTTKGKGRIRINKVPLEIYQPELSRLKILEALKLAGDRVEKLDAVNVDIIDKMIEGVDRISEGRVRTALKLKRQFRLG